MKILIPIGDTITTTEGVAVCIEDTMPPHCEQCAFNHLLGGCGCISCGPDDRPDGKNVVFIIQEGGKA